jgi:hypothetical protein
MIKASAGYLVIAVEVEKPRACALYLCEWHRVLLISAQMVALMDVITCEIRLQTWR